MAKKKEKPLRYEVQAKKYKFGSGHPRYPLMTFTRGAVVMMTPAEVPRRHREEFVCLDVEPDTPRNTLIARPSEESKDLFFIFNPDGENPINEDPLPREAVTQYAEGKDADLIYDSPNRQEEKTSDPPAGGSESGGDDSAPVVEKREDGMWDVVKGDAVLNEKPFNTKKLAEDFLKEYKHKNPGK